VTTNEPVPGAPDPAPGRPGPLAGLRVVAVEQYGAAPFGSLYLADLGAEVVKVEDPGTGGDVSRYIPPGQSGEESLFFEAFNRGKRSIALDLKSPAGRAVFERLVASADAVLSNLRGDQPSRLRITYEHLSAVNPRIVCVAVTGYGQSGPTATLPGYDALIQAEAGWAALTGDPDGPPTKSGLSLADYIAGLTAAIAMLAGVLEARATGRGRDLDTNLYDSALAMLSYPATWYLSSGFRTTRLPLSAHPSVIPFQFFRTADGHLALACPKEKFFVALVAAMGIPGVAEDPRYATFDARRGHRAELLEILESRFVERTTAAWLELLRGVVPIAPVRSMEEALDLDELDERGMLASFDHPEFGTVRSVGLPISVGGYVPVYRRGPRLGEDTAALLAELGYADDEVAALARAGAFGVASGTRGSASRAGQARD
jgi:crotonobetainyl-CoA:carnitine CoA-transferase CaiB-like acyl-CoA transferase